MGHGFRIGEGGARGDSGSRQTPADPPTHPHPKRGHSVNRSRPLIPPKRDPPKVEADCGDTPTAKTCPPLHCTADTHHPTPFEHQRPHTPDPSSTPGCMQWPPVMALRLTKAPFINPALVVCPPPPLWTPPPKVIGPKFFSGPSANQQSPRFSLPPSVPVGLAQKFSVALAPLKTQHHWRGGCGPPETPPKKERSS